MHYALQPKKSPALVLPQSFVFPRGPLNQNVYQISFLWFPFLESFSLLFLLDPFISLR